VYRVTEHSVNELLMTGPKATTDDVVPDSASTSFAAPCNLHQRVLWVMYLAGVKSGAEFGMDNLYNSVDLAHMLEAGETFVFHVPKGANEASKTAACEVEWTISGVHIVGTLRGNRGSEREYQWKEKMSAREVDELKKKPLMPDRVKCRVTADEAQVVTVSIFDSKGFQMIDTLNTEIKEETKERRVFDKAQGRPTTKDVPIMNTPNRYNKIMGFVDLDDLYQWFYRANTFRESKFWWHVYIWVTRKRADQAYKAYRLAIATRRRAIQTELQGARLAEALKAKLKDELLSLKKRELSHFDFLEKVAAYHMMRGYNSMVGSMKQIESPDQWRTVVAYGRLTNAKRVALKEAGKSKASRSPARRGQSGEASSSAAGSSAAQGEQQGEQRGRKRASRAGRYSAEPKGPVPWPAARLVGKHRLGWNDTGSATYCDYPLCNIVNASWVPQAMPPPPPKQPAASKRKKSTVGPPTLAALAAADDSDVCPPAGSQSDAASESSRASNRLQTRTKIFCKDCLDANQVRCMNFHADCYNKWHGFE
jgi:hypothetical protein